MPFEILVGVQFLSMQVAQPKIQEIQAKYADDPARQSEEVQKVYASLKFNPVAGCLPIFLQMPIFFALFTVAKSVPADAHFYSILPSISSSVSDMVASAGWVGALPYILFDVAFGVLTFIPMMMNSVNQTSEQKSQSTGSPYLYTLISARGLLHTQNSRRK